MEKLSLFRDMYSIMIEQPVLSCLFGAGLLIAGGFLATQVKYAIKEFGLEDALLAFLGFLSVIVVSMLLGSLFIALTGGL